MKRNHKAITLACLVLLLGLGACDKKGENAPSENTPATSSETNPETVILPTEEGGPGTFVIDADGVTSEKENPLNVYVDKDIVIYQIGYEAHDLAPDRTTYIYLDGQLVEKTRSTDFKSVIDLRPDKGLEKGKTHTITLVQYENDDKEKDHLTILGEVVELRRTI